MDVPINRRVILEDILDRVGCIELATIGIVHVKLQRPDVPSRLRARSIVHLTTTLSIG
jgi:hypothetical protein